MKRAFTHMFTVVVACAATGTLATVIVHRSDVVANGMNHQTDGAFRDGLFLGRLDAERGRKPHLMSGRWADDSDRRLFITAYLEGYREMHRDAVSEQLNSSRLAEQRGYRDGITDGLQHRYGSRPLRANATEHYRRADSGYSESVGELEEYKQAYREAYCNGYQLAYYGETEQIETANVLRRSAPE